MINTTLFIPFFILFFLFGIAAPKGVDIFSQTDAGYTSSAYNPADSTLSESFFVGQAFDPSFAWKIHPNWSSKAGASFSGELLSAGSRSAGFEGAFDAERAWTKRSLVLGVSGGYFSQPSALDPVQPGNYTQFNLSGKLKLKTRHPLRFEYRVLVMDETTGGRTDFKNILKARISPRFSKKFYPGIGVGFAANRSNVDGYSYDETNFLLLASYFLKSKISFLAMIYGGNRVYNTLIPTGEGRIKNPGKGTGGKNSSNGKAFQTYSTQTINILLSASKDLSRHFEVSLNYDYLLFVSETADYRYGAHRISAGLGWSFKPL